MPLNALNSDHGKDDCGSKTGKGTRNNFPRNSGPVNLGCQGFVSNEDAENGAV